MSERKNIDAVREDAGLITRIDLALVEAVAPYRDHPVIRGLGTLSELADQPPLVALSLTTTAAGLIDRNPRLARAGLRMLASHALATRIKSLVKDRVDRSRPRKVVDDGEYGFDFGESDDGEERSFPSGPSAGAVAVARALSRQYPVAAVPAGLAATVAAVVQVPRAAHFPSDVVVGTAIGLCAELLIDRSLGFLTAALQDAPIGVRKRLRVPRAGMQGEGT